MKPWSTAFRSRACRVAFSRVVQYAWYFPVSAFRRL